MPLPLGHMIEAPSLMKDTNFCFGRLCASTNTFNVSYRLSAVGLPTTLSIFWNLVIMQHDSMSFTKVNPNLYVASCGKVLEINVCERHCCSFCFACCTRSFFITALLGVRMHTLTVPLSLQYLFCCYISKHV